MMVKKRIPVNQMVMGNISRETLEKEEAASFIGYGICSYGENRLLSQAIRHLPNSNINNTTVNVNMDCRNEERYVVVGGRPLYNYRV